MAETSVEIPVPSAADGLAIRQLQHVGASYGLIFVLLLAFAWRTNAAVKRLDQRVDELKGGGAR